MSSTRKYDREKIFRMISDCYVSGESAASYCRRKNFNVKVFYRYRDDYVKLYGAVALPAATPEPSPFIELEPPTTSCCDLVLELPGAIRLRFDGLPDVSYLSSLLSSLADVTPQ